MVQTTEPKNILRINVRTAAINPTALDLTEAFAAPYASSDEDDAPHPTKVANSELTEFSIAVIECTSCQKALLIKDCNRVGK